jgi:Fe-S-cluster containining protein
LLCIPIDLGSGSKKETPKLRKAFNLPFTDSVGKIVLTYFRAASRSPFEYDGVTYTPKTLVLTPNLFRQYSCPEGCGACCHHEYSLDYLPSEIQHASSQAKKRVVKFNGKDIEIFTDNQLNTANNSGYCRHLNTTNGRCSVHPLQPFSCDFELMRFVVDCVKEPDSYRLSTQYFGRGWAMLRIDGTRGAECSKIPLAPATKETIQDISRRIRRLKDWVEYFQLEHCLDTVLRWVDSGPHLTNLTIPADKKEVAFSKPLLAGLPL